LTRGIRVFIADEDFEAEAAPCQMVAHAARSVSLNHGVDARRIEHAFRKVRLHLRSECLNLNEFAMVHDTIIVGLQLKVCAIAAASALRFVQGKEAAATREKSRLEAGATK